MIQKWRKNKYIFRDTKFEQLYHQYTDTKRTCKSIKNYKLRRKV